MAVNALRDALIALADLKAILGFTDSANDTLLGNIIFCEPYWACTGHKHGYTATYVHGYNLPDMSDADESRAAATARPHCKARQPCRAIRSRRVCGSTAPGRSPGWSGRATGRYGLPRRT